MWCLSMYDEIYWGLFEELIFDFLVIFVICLFFYCDYGDGICLGEYVFVNVNCMFFDGVFIIIGSYILIGLCV